MLTVNASVDAGTVARFNLGLERFQRELGKDSNEATRWGTILLCQSLRHETPKAKLKVPAGDVQPSSGLGMGSGPGEPKGKRAKYHGGADLPKYRHVDGVKMRLFSAVRYSQAKGRHVRSWYYPSKGAARASIGLIQNAGLAKRSWGWFMHSLFGKTMADGAKNAKAKPVTSEMVSGYARFYETGPNKGADILIHNKLDFIGEILPSGVVQRVMDNAAKQMEIRIQRAEEAIARKEGLL